MMTKMRCVHST